MEGILIYTDKSGEWGKVDTRNDDLGVLTIYFPANLGEIENDVTVEFEVKTSKTGNRYAKFTSFVSRNQAVFNTEDRDKWYVWGEDKENDFLE